MATIIATVGLPGSGKSTWALRQQEKYKAQNLSSIIITKDDIRAGLERIGWKWSHENEKVVIAEQEKIIKASINAGTPYIIIADTNFGKHLARLRKIADDYGCDFIVKNFTQVPLEICIERDRIRENPVGEQVIRDMYNKYIAQDIVDTYTPDTAKPIALICDLDGTIALHENRSPYDYSKCDTDKLNTPVANIVKLFAQSAGYTILYVSGREDWCETLTRKWLVENDMPLRVQDRLIMRKSGDHRGDDIIKRELFDSEIRNNYNVTFILDDRNRVVNMWRKLGLTCLQVAEGDF